MTAAPATEWKLTGHLVTPDADLQRGWITVAGSTITGVGPGEGPAAPTVVDAGDGLVVPGFVDLHVHGGGGQEFGGDSAGEVTASASRVARFHASHGTTALLATTVSDRPERLRMIVGALGRAVASPTPAAAWIGGIHLEGPWLSPERAGAHRPDLLRPPDPGELADLVAVSGGTIRLVTYAPELDPDGGFLRAGLAAGITMSVGHTGADHDTVIAAFGSGAAHVTHLGNAMPPLDRREPGPIGAALEAEGVTLEVIADGIHVHPGFLRLVARTAGDRMIAVTDAVAACGMPDGRYRLGGQHIVVGDHRVTLASSPEVLAGSALTMDRAVATLVASGVAVAAAVRAATATPADRAGMTDKGRLRPGADADVAVLGPALEAVATVTRGLVAWDPQGLFEPLAGRPGPGTG